MKKFIQGMYQKKNFAIRLTAVIFAVVTMGFALSWLVLVDLGTDPCTSMNLAISQKLGMGVGNFQALLNSAIFLVVLFCGREYIGFGTLANMFLVGYALQFFSWLWEQVLPAGLFDSMAVRVLVLLPSLALFVIAAAVYMDVKLGTAPYDAIAFMIAKCLPNVPFRLIRIGFDCTVIVIAFFCGGNIGIVTLFMGFTLGPVIGVVGEKISSFIECD